MICSSSFVFIFFTTASPLLIFSFIECSWDIVSFSFDIWLQRLHYSESTITCPFKTIIVCTSLGFLMAFIADSDKVNKLVLSPTVVWFNLTSPRGEMKLRFLYWIFTLRNTLPLRPSTCLLFIHAFYKLIFRLMYFTEENFFLGFSLLMPFLQLKFPSSTPWVTLKI